MWVFLRQLVQEERKVTIVQCLEPHGNVLVLLIFLNNVSRAKLGESILLRLGQNLQNPLRDFEFVEDRNLLQVSSSRVPRLRRYSDSDWDYQIFHHVSKFFLG